MTTPPAELASAQGHQAGPTARTGPHLPPILVVDDDPAARLLVRKFADKLGLANPLVEATDGASAIARLSQMVDGGSPALPCLILLDLHMPGRSGLDVLAWIRAEPVLADCPVVVLSASSEVDELNRAEQLGVSSYLVKPVGFTALADVIRRLDAPWALLRSGPASATGDGFL